MARYVVECVVFVEADGYVEAMDQVEHTLRMEGITAEVQAAWPEASHFAWKD